MAEIKVNKVTIKQKIDDNPQVDYLGHYSNSPETKRADEFAIKRDNPGRGEYEYFIAENVDGTPAERKRYAEQNYRRMEEISKGNIAIISISAEAQVIVDGHIQTIDSGIVAGYEDDGSADSESYIAEAEDEQLDELNRQLTAFGISAENVPVYRKKYFSDKPELTQKKFSNEKAFIEKKNAEKESSGMRLGMSLNPPPRSTARRSTGRGSRRGSV